MLRQAGAARIYAAALTPSPVLESSVVVPIALDITDHTRVREVAEQCGDVQILFNNAGPEAFALELLRAIEAGVEDVYPGLAADVERELRQDPKQAERRMAGLLAEARRAQAVAG